MSNPYFINAKLNSLKKNINLEDSSANYKNAGYRMDKAISNDTTYSSGTAVAKITKAISDTNIPNNIQSERVPHVINKVSIQDASSVWYPGIEVIKRWTDNAVDISSNQAQFKIWNLAQSSSSKPVYTIGNHTDFSHETGETNLFDISRNNRRDAYSRDGYDKANLGFWYSEDIQYKINFSTISISGENLYNPLRYELRSYYNETGGGDVSSNPTGSTIILENAANASSYIYFDDLSGVPSIVKNGANMIQYTTNNKINGIPNLHLFSDKTFSIRLKYLVNNYSTRFLLDKDISILKHFFSYNLSNLKDISWKSHTSSAPNIASNGYKRDTDKWDISGLEINTAANLDVATSGITLKIDATNTLDSSGITINNTHSDVYKFIYDKPTITEFNDISNSLCEIPSGFDPTFSTGSHGKSSNLLGNYVSFGDISNALQMSMWNGYFYSNTGWQQNGIDQSNSSDYGMLNSLPVFNISNASSCWVIFKYNYTFTTDGNFNRVMCVINGSDNSADPEIHIDDLSNNNIEIYLYTGVSISGYYWFKISSGNDNLTLPKAYNRQLGYTSLGLGDGKYETMSNDDFITGATISSASKAFTSAAAFGGTLPKRIIGAYINRIDFSENENFNFYIAIKAKNDINKRIKRPSLYVATDTTQIKTFQFN
jgi:hypothetical protein